MEELHTNEILSLSILIKSHDFNLLEKILIANNQERVNHGTVTNK